MSDRLSAEERVASLWSHLPVEVQQAWSQHVHEGFVSLIAMQIHDAEQAAAEAERERLQDEIQAYQSDPNYDNRYLHGQDDMREPITDKSICSRGHPRACLVEREITNIEKNEGPLNDTEYCSACTQLEAELKPLRDALEQALKANGVCVQEQNPNEFPHTCCNHTLCELGQAALRQHRG